MGGWFAVGSVMLARMPVPGFCAPQLAIVRDVPDAYSRCLRTQDVTIDVDRARTQHREYVAALVAAGIEVQHLPGDEAHPDACFVEDTAVLLGPRAMISRPGAPSRRGECGPVAAGLAGRCELHTLGESAILDGGDVLRAGSRLFVGLSGRTDLAGARALAALAAHEQLTVHIVPVAVGLHLKSAVTLVDERTLVVLDGALDPDAFTAAGLEILRVHEPAGGNVLALGSRVLVSADAPATAALLAARGHDVWVVDVSEFHRGDGALTCLSLRQPPPGGWCA